MIAEYLPATTKLLSKRLEPAGVVQRATVWILSRLGASRWYRLNSAKLEWLAWRRFEGFDGVLHFLWADRDWGFLDLLRDRRRLRICATFHCSPDTLEEVLHFPARLRALDAIILVSEAQRPFFLAQGVRPHRIYVIHHGVDTKFFCPGPPRPAPRPSNASAP